MKRILSLVVLMLVGFWNANAQMSTNACESSPCNAIQICGIGSKVNNYSYTSTGNPQGTCGANFFTNNWVYYRLTCFGAGNLIFTITPNDPVSDINWAFWNITTTGCGSLSNTTDCSAAVTAGAVTSTTIALTAGNTYIIGMQRASGGTVTTGFNINFTGTTANLTDNVQPSMASLIPFNICLPVTNVKVKLSESVRCSQLDAGDFSITNSPSFSVTASSCPGCVNATLPLTNYSNFKDTLSFTFTPALAPGTYTLSFNSSSATLPRDVCNNLPNTVPNVTFTVPVPLTLAYTTSFNCTAQTYTDNLSATNGASPYQYKVKGGAQINTYSATTTYSGLQGGVTYTLYCKDNNTCEDSTVITHTPVIPLQSPNLAASASPPCYNQFCGANGDSITAAAMSSGVAPYTWSIASSPASAMTGATFTSPSTWKCMTFTAGATFTVTVTDALGCTKTASKSLINPTQLTMPTPTGTNPLCYGDSSGSMTVQASGGTGPWNYTYATSYSTMTYTNSSASHIGNLAAGMPAATYTVSVIDAHGCTTSSTKTLSSNPQIVIKTTNSPNPVTYWNPTCNAPSSGKIKPYATGGVGTKKDFWIYNSYPGTPFDSVKYIGVVSVTDSFFYQSLSYTNGLTAGSYTVIAKDQAGCTASAVYTLSLPAYPDLVMDSVINATCYGSCTGKIYTTTNGPAIAPFTYSITPATVGSCAATAFGTGDYQTLAGNSTYTVVVTKNYSGDLCMDSITVNVTQPTQLNFTSVNTFSITCNGANTGSINVAASGGTGQITFTITPSGPQSNTIGQFTNLIAQCYTITATDANGCTVTTTACLVEPTALTLTISNIDSVTCNGLCDGEALATAGGGTLPYTYSINSGTIDPSTGDIEDLCATTYIVTVTDGNLCTKTVTFTVNQPPSLTAVSAVTQNALCFGDCNGTATVTPSGGTLTYSYAIAGPGSPSITNAAGNTGAATNLCVGTYTVTVTDYHSCTTIVTITITQPNVLTAVSSIVNHPTCANQCNGTATVTPNGGTTPYSYTIVGNGIGTPAITTPGNNATATGLCNDTYTVTVTDANGCTTTTTIHTIDPAQLVINSIVVTNALCNGNCNGTATISVGGGTPAYSYGLNPTSISGCIPTLTGNVYSLLHAGTYTMTTSDANGCTATSVMIVNEPAVFAVDTVSKSNVSCNGLCDGGIVMTYSGGTGPASYGITPNVPCVATQNSVGNFGNLGANVYVVTGTDAQGCTATKNITITQPSIPSVTITTGSVPSCTPGCDGTAQANPSGGSPGYTYVISSGATISASGAITGICAGIAYTVTTTDSHGCTATVTFSMTTPNGPVVHLSGAVQPTCNPGCDGSVVVTVTGGISPYTYGVNNGGTVNPIGPTAATTSNGSGLCDGVNYTFNVHDANNCVGTEDTLLNHPAPPTVNVVTTNVTCNGLCNGTAVLSALGGTGTTIYGNLVWQNAMTCVPVQGPAGTYTGLGANTYTVTGTDASGCTTTKSFTITQPPVLTVAVAAFSNPLCNGNCNGTISLNTGGGFGAIGLSISPTTNGTCNASLAGNTFNNLWGTQAFTVTATDASGCTVTTTKQLTQPAVLTLNNQPVTNVSCNGLCNGAVVMTYAGGTGPLSYSITPNTPCPPIQNPVGTFGNLGANVYVVTGTDANGCTATKNVTITQPTVLNLNTVNGITPSCVPGCDGTAQANASGGTPGYTYSIAGGAAISATGAITNICSGTNYTITATDAQGCNKTAVISIVTPGGPTLQLVSTTDPWCVPSCNGTANVTVVGGMQPFTYTITNGGVMTPPGPTNATSSIASGLCPSIQYVIKVTDANSCPSTVAVLLNEPTPPSIDTLVTTPVSCNPGCDGTATLSPIGLTYNIIGIAGQVAANTVFGLCAGTNYFIVGTDASNGCTDTLYYIPAYPAPVTINITSSTLPSCNPGCDATATLSPVNYIYNILGQSAVAGNVVGGMCYGNTYSIIGTDPVSGCKDTVTFTPLQPLGVAIDTLSIVHPSCVPGCDGIVTMTPVNLTYTITPIIGSPSIVGNVLSSLCVGHYTITGTDANGCANTTVIILVSPNLPAAPTLTSTVASPYGTSNGTITVTNILAGATYSISPAVGTQPTTGNFIGLIGDTVCMAGANNYTITVTNSLGCTASDTICVMSDPETGCSFSQTNVLCNSLCTGAFDVNAIGGVGVITYTSAPAVATPNFMNDGIAANLCAGPYVVTATDANGGTCQVTVTITQPSAVGFNAPLVNVATCTSPCSGSINITANGGVSPYTYSIISPAAGCQASQASASVGNFANVGVGTYTITTTDANGCTKSTTVAVGPPSPPVINSVLVTNVTCNSACNGQVIVNASNTAFYSLDNGVNSQPSNTFNSICAGSYTVVATASNGCTASSAVVVTEPTPLVIDSLNASPTTCSYTSNGTAQVYASGGVTPYQYSLNCINYQLSPNFNNLAAGSYTICVKDANGCTISIPLSISSPPAIVWNIALSTNILCNGSSTGSINVVGTGGTGTIQYSLNSAPSVVNGNFTGLTAGSYTVVAVDANGCTLSAVFNITQPPALTLSAPTVVNNQCFGTSAGSIGINAGGGVPGYVFTIAPSPGSVQQPTPGNFINLPAGFYIITVQDTNGCTKSTLAIQVTHPPQLNLVVQNQTNIDCHGQATGAIVVSANGGTPGYGYLLQPNNIVSGTGSFNNLTAGTYTLFAVDNNQCTVSTVVTLTEPPAIAVALVTPTEPICNGEANGTLTITAQGGFPPYQFSLDGGPLQPGGTFVGLVAKWYTILIVDSKGCQHSEQYELTEPEKVGATLDIRDARCINSKDGRIVVTGTGGRGDYSYFIMPGLLFNKSGIFTDLKPGVYHLRVTDISDCEYLIDFTINPPANPIGVSITKQDLGCTGKGFEGQATANVFGGLQPYTYLWFTSPPQTDPVADSLYYGWYNLMVTDAYGCVVKDSVYIQEGPCCDVSFIPNAFSPNGDGNNDVFHVMTTAGIELQQLAIFDRWGKLVWSTNNYRFGWDGKEDGKDADVGNYMYVYRYKCTTDQKNYVKKGDVMLVR